MDEDNDIFEMFLEIIAALDQKDPEGRMRILSQNPRFDENTEPNKSISHRR